jgi:hypothetical protein
MIRRHNEYVRPFERPTFYFAACGNLRFRVAPASSVRGKLYITERQPTFGTDAALAVFVRLHARAFF